MRIHRLVALLVAMSLLLGGCAVGAASSHRPAPTVPAGTAIGPGVTQFAEPDGAPVLWGLAAQRDPASIPMPRYPLKVSLDGRYLTDQDNQPWRVQADGAWLMSANATPDEVDRYLATRQAQGFNSFYLMAMVHPGGYPAAPSAPNNQAGDEPFAVPDDFSTAGASPSSERYWSWIDSIIDKAAQHGMVVMLAYTYLGFAGEDQGWYKDVLAQRDQQTLFDWGRWLGNRYKDKPNIMWFGLGDYSPPSNDPDAQARVRAIADGIKAAGASQLFMGEPSGPDGLPAEVDGFGAILDQNSFYGYGPRYNGAVYETADRAYRFAPTEPAWVEEGTYEYETNIGSFSGKPWETRRSRFWAVLGGGTAGDGFGSREAWQWKEFPKSLDTPGAQYSTAAFDLFAGLPWWTLRPSGTDPGFAGRSLIPSGGGTWGQLDFITSAMTDDGHWLLAYVPVSGSGARTFTVDMSGMSGPVTARWFDPATGNYLAIGDGGAHPTSSSQTFATPGMRSDHTNDWVLVLSTQPDPCGTISTTGLYTAPPTKPEGLDCAVTATSTSDLSTTERTPAPMQHSSTGP